MAGGSPLCATSGAVVGHLQSQATGECRRAVPALSGPAPPQATTAAQRPPGAVPLGLAGSGPLATVAPRTPQRRAGWPAVARSRRAIPAASGGSEGTTSTGAMAPVLMVCSDSAEAVRIARRERATNLGPSRLLRAPIGLRCSLWVPPRAPTPATWRPRASSRAGRRGGPGHMDGSGRGRGSVPTPNPKPPPLVRGGMVRG